MNNFNDIDKNLINKIEMRLRRDENYFDFLNYDTKEYTHIYHSYPAMMIPMLVRELISIMLEENTKINNLYDPFCGSGTTAVEGILSGLEIYTNDINPLSTLITKVKTNIIEPSFLDCEFEKLKVLLENIEMDYNNGKYKLQKLPNFKNIDYWFKKEVIIKLQLIKETILNIKNIEILEFFLVVFSETVRFVSNTRKNEFKLYRLDEYNLDKWNPNVFKEFKEFCIRNIEGNRRFFLKISNKENCKKHIFNKSSMNLSNIIKDEKFDLLITSPPYGDSKTTVAYGQFSRLSLQWLDMNNNLEVNQLDNIMLGGKIDKNMEIMNVINNLKSKTLSKIFNKIKENDNFKENRAIEVLQFFKDIDRTLFEISKVMKINSYQYWVVANRTVKNVNIPMDDILIELFSKYNIKYIYKFYRNIPNKRMPKSNSPTNEKGKKVSTMNKEIILIFRKEK